MNVSLILNLIISLEKELKGEEIEKLNSELCENFLEIIESDNESIKNQSKPDTFYRIFVAECRMLN